VPPHPKKTKSNNKAKPSHKNKHKNHKKSLVLTMHSVDTPIICFPYRWKDDDSDEKCVNNRQYHRKGKDLPNKMAKSDCVKHLLSFQVCCKRFLCAYFLNLKQLHNTDGLLTEIMTNCNTLVQQLLLVTNKNHVDTNNNTSVNNNDNLNSHLKIMSETDKDLSIGNNDLIMGWHETCLSSSTTDITSPEGFHHTTNSSGSDLSTNSNISKLSKLIDKQHVHQPSQTFPKERTKKSMSLPGSPSLNMNLLISDILDYQTHNESNKNKITATNTATNTSQPAAMTNTTQEIIITESTLMPEVKTQSCPALQYDYFGLDMNDGGLDSFLEKDKKNKYIHQGHLQIRMQKKKFPKNEKKDMVM